MVQPHRYTYDRTKSREQDSARAQQRRGSLTKGLLAAIVAFFWVLSVLVVGLMAYGSGLNARQELNPPTVAQKPAPIQLTEEVCTTSVYDLRLVSEGIHLGCSTPTQYDLLARLKEKRGYGDVYHAKSVEALANRECERFFGGDKVYLVSTGILSGMIKIRRKGDRMDYWTDMDTLQKF